LHQRPIRSALALVLGAVALVAVAAASPAGAQTVELPEELRSIAGVRFRGLHHLGRHQLAAAGMRTRAPSFLPWRERPPLRRDYLRSDSAAIVSIYRHYGYLDAAVSVKLLPGHDPRTAYVEFEVREGLLTRVSSVELAGVPHYPESELRRGLLAQPRRPFDPVFLQLDALKIRALYQERGFGVSVDTLSRRGVPDSVHVAVRYGVTEGPQYRVGHIQYIGDGKLRESLGRRELMLRPGDVFRRSRLDLSVEHMYSTGLFRQVQVTTLPDSAAGTMDLLVRVRPRPARWVDLGVGSGTSDRFRSTAQWGHRNLDTRALGGVLDGELAWYGDGKAHRRNATATLTEPWLFGVRLLGQGATFYREQHERAYNNLGANLYTQHADSRGFSFSLSRELSRLSRLTLLGESALVHQRYTIDIPIAQIADTTVSRLESQTIPRYRANTLRLTLERDMRNDRIAPSRGSYQSFVPEFAGGWLKGQTNYTKAVLSSTWYTPIANGWLVAIRATAGVMGPFGPAPENFTPDLGLDERVARLPRESRFFIGGVNSLRGYDENAVTLNGGLAMALANVEFRIPVAGPFGIEVFLDAGNVWDRPEYIQARDLVLPWQATRSRPGDIRYAYGLGGRLVLPFGPLRVDVARADRPDFPFASARRGHSLPFAYQFAIGPSF
jgi:outer membrane protein insertion porin family